MSAFPAFDRRPYHLNDDGIAAIGDDPDREVIEDECVIEPHDDRSDMCVSIPVRSSITSGCGPAVEIGPFTLDSRDTIALYNTLARHLNRFPSEFRTTGSPA